MRRSFTSGQYRQWKTDWAEFIRNANQQMREGLARRLNRASDEVVQQMRSNMAKVGIHENTGKLRGSLRIDKATPEKPKCVIYSEVFVMKPKKPNWNRHLWRKKGWYMNGLNLGKDLRYPAMGTPYGRILEFSPRFHKAFFYKSWYEKQMAIRQQMVYFARMCWQEQGKMVG